LRVNVLKASTNVTYADYVSARTSVVGFPSSGTFKKVVRNLKAANAKPITSVLSGSPSYATTPVAAAYIGLCHTDCQADLEAISGFKTVDKYANPSSAFEGELGSLGEIRFIGTTMFTPFEDAGGDVSALNKISTTGTNADVYPIIIFGRDAYATVPLRGANCGTILVANPKATTSDPLAQRGTIGWKFWNGTIILNSNFVERVECAVTKNPT